jgi:hypothetical protein
MRQLALVTLAVLAYGCNDDPHDHDPSDLDAATPPPPQVTSTRGRLAIAGGEADDPVLWVVDLDDGEIVYEDRLITPGTVYSTSPTSQYAHVNQRLANVLDILDSGTRRESVPVAHVSKTTPGLHDVFFDGLLPTHWVSHDGWVVVFNDGDGSIDYLYEPSLETSRVILRHETTDGAHHGVAVMIRNHLLASSSVSNPTPQNPDARRAAGVTLRRLNAPSTIIDSNEECLGLHGESASHEVVAFGCVDGILVAEWTGATFAFRKLLHPESLPQPELGNPYRVGTVRAHDGVNTIIGNWGPSGFVVIDINVEPATWTYVDVGSIRRSFVFSPDGDSLLILAGDGKLHKFDPESGLPLGEALSVTEPFESNAGAPVLVVGLTSAFVLDARERTVVEIDLDDWRKDRTFQMPHAPLSAAVFGAIP